MILVRPSLNPLNHFILLLSWVRGTSRFEINAHYARHLFEWIFCERCIHLIHKWPPTWDDCVAKHGIEAFWDNISNPVPSSETQGLLAGTIRYFRANDIFGRKFTLSAEEPLGTYSYRTSSRTGRILFRWLGRKMFFCPISGKEFDQFWNWFGKNKFPGALQHLK